MARGLELWANPSSPHGEGRAARKALEEARQTLAEVLGWRHDVIFTSGASEAVTIAAKRAKAPGRAYLATEHDIVPASMGEGAAVLPVGKDGLIDLAALDTALAKGPALVAVQQVNNETGILQPLDRLAVKIREAGSLLLADCAQSAGKYLLPDADFIALSAHKLGGPPGIGALLVRDLGTLEPVGGQEKGYRRGTQDAPSALAFAAALAAKPYDMDRLATLRTRLDDGVKAAGGVVIGDDPEAALEGALGALERADLDETTLARVEAEIEAAMANVEVELAEYEGRRSLSESEEEALEARIEGAIERAEAAIERAVERIEDAHDRHGDDKAKIWRPRY